MFKKPVLTLEQISQRLRLPRQGEIFGQVLDLKGGSRMMVECLDGKTRLCRIPGKIRSKLWIKAGDWVLVTPWSIEPNEKADIAFRYTNIQAEMLRKKGFLK
ncbi:translation initiation factor eIF-1A [Candidatus Micrarchaeota archaeon]|nr:translation initiation factor eIF-1A [Candidatus Micrarchaeota archaeon]